MSLICDFCSEDKEPLVYVDCQSFDVKHTVNNFPMASSEGWWSCPLCFEIIQNGDKEGLFNRSKQSWIDKNPGKEWDDRTDPYLWEFQKQFWENKR